MLKVLWCTRRLLKRRPSSPTGRWQGWGRVTLSQRQWSAACYGNHGSGWLATCCLGIYFLEHLLEVGALFGAWPHYPNDVLTDEPAGRFPVLFCSGVVLRGVSVGHHQEIPPSFTSSIVLFTYRSLTPWCVLECTCLLRLCCSRFGSSALSRQLVFTEHTGRTVVTRWRFILQRY